MPAELAAVGKPGVVRKANLHVQDDAVVMEFPYNEKLRDSIHERVPGVALAPEHEPGVPPSQTSTWQSSGQSITVWCIWHNRLATAGAR